jgi:ABC-type transporter Mla subunit MlaD
MSARSKNIAVGVTVLVALAMLGTMILLFAGMPQFLRGGYKLTVKTADSGGAKQGDTVNARGMAVGKITNIDFADVDPREGVIIKIHINKGIRLPAGTKAYISQGIIGGTSVSLDTSSKKPGLLPDDGSAVIEGDVSNMDIGRAVQSLDKLATNISALVGTAPEPTTAAGQGTTTTSTTTQATAQATFQNTVARLNETLASLNVILADQENQKNIKITLEELKKFTANGAKAMEAFTELARETQNTAAQATKAIHTFDKATSRASDDVSRLAQGMLKDTEDVSRAMMTLDKTLAAIASGQGTTGKMITDPHLYNQLVDVADQMSSMLKEAREVMQIWKEKGVPLKLK